MSISFNIQALEICLIAMCVSMHALGLRAYITDIIIYIHVTTNTMHHTSYSNG